MNNIHSNASIVLSLEALWLWLMAKPGRPAATPALKVIGSQLVASPTRVKPLAMPVNRTQQPTVTSQKPAPMRSVRVLQVMDAGQGPAQSGRLRISGRMADVCAELDRMAACEALQH